DPIPSVTRHGYCHSCVLQARLTSISPCSRTFPFTSESTCSSGRRASIVSIWAEAGLLKGKQIGIDATTLEANAAMRSIVRRDSGESYEAFLTGLAQESGIETPTREELARLDRKRKKKGCNRTWVNPHDREW